MAKCNIQMAGAVFFGEGKMCHNIAITIALWCYIDYQACLVQTSLKITSASFSYFFFLTAIQK